MHIAIAIAVAYRKKCIATTVENFKLVGTKSRGAPAASAPNIASCPDSFTTKGHQHITYLLEVCHKIWGHQSPYFQ